MYVPFRNLTLRGGTSVRACLPLRRPDGERQFQNDKGGLVSARSRGRIPQEPRFETANEAWKARWGDHLAWSTMFAVAAHAAAFAFSPGWDRLDSWVVPDVELLEVGTEWISLDAPPSSGGGGRVVLLAPLSLLEEPDSVPVAVDAGTNTGSSGLAAATFSGGLRERLLGRGGPVPTIVEPAPMLDRLALGDDPQALEDDPLALEDDSVAEEDDPVAEEDDPLAEEDDPPDTAEEEGFPSILVNPTIADPAFRLETSTLNLSRMSGKIPELFRPGTSAWLLIQNPTVVEEYMRIVALNRASDERGQVNVAIWIDDRGSVEWSEVTRSSGNEDMDEVALALFNRIASFRPGRDRGVRISMSVIFSIVFPW